MAEPLVEMHNITKQFPGVRALSDVSISLLPGEVHALVGENGAGKSTLIKILSGVLRPDAGEIIWRGKKIEFSSPLEALACGIGAIYQEFNLVPQLTVAQNIMLGQAPHRWGAILEDEMHRRARVALAQLGFELDTHTPVSELNVAQQQIVEIAKALARELQLLIMDEPTAALNQMEIKRLFDVIRKLKSQGVTVLYISHRLREIFEIADVVTVLKDGKLVDSRPIKEVSEDAVVRMMVGRELANIYPPKNTATATPILKVEGLSLRGVLENISFELHRGEILGIAGLEGQGQRHLVRAIVGAIPHDHGTIYRDGRPVTIDSPADALKAGIAFIPEDRKAEGLILVRSVQENISLPSLWERIRLLFIDERRERDFVGHLIERLGIKVSRPSQIARNLSGGNQQKVVVAKSLGVRPEVLVMAEPTRGVDVGAKSEVHHIMRDLAAQGVGILMVSSELPEILGMSDWVLVMSQGRIVAEMSGDQATEEAIIAAATMGGVQEKAA